FGVVLYELLAGKRPFGGATDLEVLKTIMHGEPQPLSGEVPALLSSLVEKTLEKDPAERYQSMREMVVDLKRVTRQKPQDAAPVAVLGRPPKGRRWRWMTGGLASALAIGAALWILRMESP